MLVRTRVTQDISNLSLVFRQMSLFAHQRGLEAIPSPTDVTFLASLDPDLRKFVQCRNITFYPQEKTSDGLCLSLESMHGFVVMQFYDGRVETAERRIDWDRAPHR